MVEWLLKTTDRINHRGLRPFDNGCEAGAHREIHGEILMFSYGETKSQWDAPCAALKSYAL